jgi:histidyl-tRNA synthetase
MSYYTGPIFEIELLDKSNLSLSIAGGGRYDEMIAKYSDSKTQTPACGFSIGFERIVSILKAQGITLKNQEDPTVYLISPDAGYSIIETVFLKANELRTKSRKVMISPKNKNLTKQIDKLLELGYEKFIDVSSGGEKILNIKARLTV